MMTFLRFTSISQWSFHLQIAVFSLKTWPLTLIRVSTLLAVQISSVVNVASICRAA